MHKKSSKTALKAVLFLLILLNVSPVLAVDKQPGLIFSVTPPIFKTTLSPGDIWSSSIKIINDNTNELTVSPSVMDYNVIPGGKGGGDLIFNENNFLNDVTPADWVKLEQQGSVVAKQQSSTDIPFTIKIPENTPPGEYFVAIVVSDQPIKKSKDDV